MLSPRATVLSIPAYHPPLAGRNGLRLDFNENTVGCSPRVLQRVRQLSAEDLACYPEREPVEEAVAGFLNVDPSELLLTNGVDEAIHLLCQSYLETGDEAIIIAPTYSMYRIYIAGTGAQATSVPASDDFKFPTQAVLEQVGPRTRFIAIANPNNPTGAVASTSDLLRVIESAPNAAVLIDEAYFEFYGRTLLPRHRDFPNLFIARTFSKAYGMAGLRVGALIGDAEQLRVMRRVCSPYNVNAAALACLPEAIADQVYIQQYVAEVRESRTRLQNALRSHGVPFWPSEANFVLARIAAAKEGATVFVEEMRRRGILVRDRSSDYACEGCARMTLGPRHHSDRLLNALQEVCAESTFASGAPRS
jgi:histidinol-phosphate aminotransferase